MYNPWTIHFKIMSAKLSKNASFLFLFSTLIRFLKIPKRDLRLFKRTGDFSRLNHVLILNFKFLIQL